ncbi:tRNA-dihydrouridine synthase [Methanobrevibacter sp. OttesenSCG-928-K11]|nr:tRNA-dihydrouridine synthase [Methanobrevibacter sp. OttesenSCG-928-K11]MDL2271255.1 tRNA-dihydrouridine synthase [Methanobrevibacter sp. OttesenSCG-928-I08]
MAGITNADFLIKVIPYGFDMVTLGGYNIDSPTINAGDKILKRGRSEFNIPKEEIFNHISEEVNKIKNFKKDILVSANLRSTTPDEIIKISKIPNLDVVEINCHCRQKELLAIDCGQNMLKRPDLKDFICEITENARSIVSVKIRANVPGVDTLKIAKLIDECGVDFIHVDAMNPGVPDADFDIISKISDEIDGFLIGNNSINNENQIKKMLNSGADGFSIGRSLINGSLDFKI